MTITLVNFTNNYINEKIIIIIISPLVSTVSPVSLVSLSLHSLLGLQLSLVLLSLLVYISTGLHSPWSPSVSNCLSYFFLYLCTSPQSLWCPSISKCLSYFFKYERHLKEERPLLVYISIGLHFSLLGLPQSLILLSLLVYISTGLHSLSSLLGLPRSPTVSHTCTVYTSKERSTRDSWRPRETKETGKSVETSGCAHKHK